MAKLGLIEFPKWLHNMWVVPQYCFGDKLQDAGMHLVFLEIFLKLVVCTLEDYFLLNEGPGTIEAFLRLLVTDQLLMLCHHEKHRVFKLPHVERNVIEKFHHTVDELEGHERCSLLVLKELFEYELVTANHMDRKARVYQEFLCEIVLKENLPPCEEPGL